jgi:hypothetical protein
MQQSSNCNNQANATIKQMQQSSKCNNQANATIKQVQQSTYLMQKTRVAAIHHESAVFRINSLLEVKVNQKTV